MSNLTRLSLTLRPYNIYGTGRNKEEFLHLADSAVPTGAALDLTSQAEVQGTWLEQVHSWVVTVDHKKIGIMYIVYALVFLLVGGAEALLLRIQLAVPHNNFISPEVFNRLFTMHG